VLTFAVATPDHLASLLPNLRPEDVRELVSSTGHGPATALIHSLSLSEITVVALGEAQEVVAMFGLAAASETTGVPWMVASTAAPAHARDIARHSRPIADRMNARYPLLVNAADCRNSLHIRWLTWAGFELGEVTTEHAADGSPFITFHRSRTHV